MKFKEFTYCLRNFICRCFIHTWIFVWLQALSNSLIFTNWGSNLPKISHIQVHGRGAKKKKNSQKGQNICNLKKMRPNIKHPRKEIYNTI